MHPEFWRVLLTLLRPLLVAGGSPLVVIAALSLVHLCGEDPLSIVLPRLLDQLTFLALLLIPGLTIGALGCPAGSTRTPWLSAALAPLAIGPSLAVGFTIYRPGPSPEPSGLLRALLELTPLGYLPGLLTAALPSLCLVQARRGRIRFLALIALAYALVTGLLISGFDISGTCTPASPSILVAAIYGAAASGLVLGPIAADRLITAVEARLEAQSHEPDAPR